MGGIWVYGSTPTFDKKLGDDGKLPKTYCNPTVFYFAFAFVTVHYSLAALACFGGVGLALCEIAYRRYKRGLNQDAD